MATQGGEGAWSYRGGASLYTSRLGGGWGSGPAYPPRGRVVGLPLQCDGRAWPAVAIHMRGQRAWRCHGWGTGRGATDLLLLPISKWLIRLGRCDGGGDGGRSVPRRCPHVRRDLRGGKEVLRKCPISYASACRTPMGGRSRGGQAEPADAPRRCSHPCRVDARRQQVGPHGPLQERSHRRQLGHVQTADGLEPRVHGRGVKEGPPQPAHVRVLLDPLPVQTGGASEARAGHAEAGAGGDVGEAELELEVRVGGVELRREGRRRQRGRVSILERRARGASRTCKQGRPAPNDKQVRDPASFSGAPAAPAENAPHMDGQPALP
jgi:hypothetical protein